MDVLTITSPGDLFSGDKDTLRSEFDALAHKYHPDKNGSSRATDQFIHLKKLYELARVQLEKGFWEGKNFLRFSSRQICLKEMSYQIGFFRKLEFELGKMYVGNNHVTFLIKKEHETLWRNAWERIVGLTYPNDKIKNEMVRFLPVVKKSDVATDFFMLTLNKTSDLILLRDVPHNLPDWDRHVTWIIGTLYNLACYLEVVGLTHNDISLDTYFISPKYHSGVLLGGWWYSQKEGQKLKALPSASYDLFPPKMREKKVAVTSHDRELIKALGRELLGDRGGTRLVGTAPTQIVNWLRCSTSKTALAEYRLWEEVITEAYGKRKFVKMDLSAKTLYGGK